MHQIWGQLIWKITAVSRHFIIIYLTIVIICCPQDKGQWYVNCISICIYIHVIVFYFVFSAVLLGLGLNLTNLQTFGPLCVLVCLNKFAMFQYILRYKCMFVCILSNYTYSGTEYSDGQFDSDTWVQ